MCDPFGPCDEFDWDDDEIQIIPAQAAIAVYTNPEGSVVVRQQDVLQLDGDPFIVIRPENAERICQAIMREAGAAYAEALALPAPGSASPKDRTAAERQRRYRERKRNADRDVTPKSVTRHADELIRLEAAE